MKPYVVGDALLRLQGYPIVGIAGVMALLAALIVGLKWISARWAVHPELLRKIVHVCIGLSTLSFPWVFADVWPVAVLAALSAVLLAAVKTPGPLRELMGGVVDRVDRRSFGDLYFPLGVTLLFWLSRRSDPQTARLLFCVPMLLLTLGDSFAAIIGVTTGRHKFTTDEGVKSVEGSIACIVAAAPCTYVPLVLIAHVGQPRALEIAAIVALLAGVLEAIAWGGLDNLFLPLGGFALLKTHMALSLASLQIHLAATIALLLFAIAWRRRTTLDDSAVLGAALYAYGAWSIGGLEWIYAPAVLFCSYTLLWPRIAEDAVRRHTVSVVLAVGAAGLGWLMLATVFHRPGFSFAYDVAFGAQMAMIGLVRLRHRYPAARGISLVPLAASVGWMLMTAPALLATIRAAGTERAPLVESALAALAGVLLATLLFDRLRRDLRNYPCDPARWRLQSALGALGSAVGMVPAIWRH